jgi:uncharacterized protein (DUF58 family)
LIGRSSADSTDFFRAITDPVPGSGLDLAELREYQYNDDVRYIDWNVTARSKLLMSVSIWKTGSDGLVPVDLSPS